MSTVPTAVVAADAAGLRPVRLVLCGSFFPLHEGHLDVLRAARSHCETVMGLTVEAGVLLPTSLTSLCRKFSGGGVDLHPDDFAAPSGRDRHGAAEKQSDVVPPAADPRDVWAATVLRGSSCASWVRWVGGHRGGVSAAVQAETAAAASAQVRVVQVTGVDSKVRAVLRGKKYGDVIAVVDSRGVPLENRELFQPSGGAAPSSNVCVAYGPTNACLMSSTIERYWQQRRLGAACLLYPSPCLRTRFSVQWLSDTGVTLGSGRQGIVRLMALGAHPVAVKLLPRGGRHDHFHVEAPLWHQLQAAAVSGAPPVTPTLIATGTCLSVDDEYEASTAGDPCAGFHYIVTELGVPLNEVLRIDYKYRWSPMAAQAENTKPRTNVDRQKKGDAHTAVGADIAAFLEARPRVRLPATAFSAVRSWPQSHSAAAPNASPAASRPDGDLSDADVLQSGTVEALTAEISATRGAVDAFLGRATGSSLHFGAWVASEMRSRVAVLASHGILHRDVKLENFVLFPDGSLRLCDFGVAHREGEQTRISRGNMRQYPPRAAASMFYDASCDEYMAAMAAFEALTGRPIYYDCGDDMQAVLALKRSNVMPTWPAYESAAAGEASMRRGSDDAVARSQFEMALQWIDSVWREHHDASCGRHDHRA